MVERNIIAEDRQVVANSQGSLAEEKLGKSKAPRREQTIIEWALGIIYRPLGLAVCGLQTSSKSAWKLKGAILCRVVSRTLGCEWMFTAPFGWFGVTCAVITCSFLWIYRSKGQLESPPLFSTDDFSNAWKVNCFGSIFRSLEESHWKDCDGDEVRFPKSLGEGGGAGTSSRSCSFYKWPGLLLALLCRHAVAPLFVLPCHPWRLNNWLCIPPGNLGVALSRAVLTMNEQITFMSCVTWFCFWHSMVKLNCLNLCFEIG